MGGHIQDVEFLGSFPKFKDLPESELPEFCFWGRSNVGKSSLINYLSNRKAIAKVSSTPGKTQAFNQFVIDQSWIMMDMPGYGYAQVSKKVKSQWAPEAIRYLTQRKNLCLVFLLVDLSIPPQRLDLETMAMLGNKQIPFYILFTKTDKCRKRQLTLNREFYKKALLENWETLPVMMETSAESKTGREDVLEAIREITIRLK